MDVSAPKEEESDEGEKEEVNLWDPEEKGEYSEKLEPLRDLIKKVDYNELEQVREWINETMKKKYPEEAHRFTPWSLEQIEQHQ